MPREKLVEDFRLSMVGPGLAEEVLVDTPTRTYVTGFLSPIGAVVDDSENDEFQEGDRDSSLEGLPSLINAMWPSAMGLTFNVRREVEQIRVKITGGFYEHVSAPEGSSTKGAVGEEEELKGNPFEQGRCEEKEDDAAGADSSGPKGEPRQWKRVPFEKVLTLLMVGPEQEELSVSRGNGPRGGLFLDVRRFDHGDSQPRLATLSLINRNEFTHGEWEERELHTFFQPVLEVVAGEGEDSDCFVEAPAVSHYREDPDLAQHLLLYRNACDFATGHGCAVEWTESESSYKAAHLIRTQFIPTETVPDLHYDIFKTEEEGLGKKLKEVVQAACEMAPEDEPEVIFTMRHLGGGREDDWILSALRALCDAYEFWLENREGEIEAAIEEVRDADRRDYVREEAAKLNILESGPQILARMRAGIEALVEDETVFRAFRLANEAMHTQLEMSILQKRKRNGDAVSSLEELDLPEWRPFQLAFLLLTINSIANPVRKIEGSDDAERDLMDLIWFPTGGGKTEAYLGLTAFTLFYRRLSREDPDSGAGVSVFTRYTLRLLTTQQFERATRLICACERLRIEAKDLRGEELHLGKKKFAIGLWIGSASAPNRFQDGGSTENPIEGAVAIVNKLNRGQEPDGQADVRHIRLCPWCGNEISNRDISVIDENGKKIRSTSRGREMLPYRLRVKCGGELPPPHAGKCPFGGDEEIPVQIVDDEIYQNPPSVVIGTVDKFVQLAWRSETRSLFGRLPDGSRLPPPDLIIQDELHLISGPLGTMVGLFEAAVDLIACDEEESRSPKIVGSTATIRRAEDQVRGLFNRGVCQFPPPELTAGDAFFARVDKAEPGRRYMGIMAPGTSGKSLFLRCCGALLQLAGEIEEDARDPYWTLVCYFNSIRELAGANVLAQDDVPSYMKTFSQIRERVGGSGELRKIGGPEELTSRRSSGEIPAILKSLQDPYELPDGGEALDLLLATNMISVGVDVDRLGLMMILGQPKTTAEYIQASSRVGRQHPGLVLTLANWTRSRDRSHYERFVPYHQAYYREVEPTSVTPWSGPARDRMLSGVLITALRQIEERLAPSPSALKEIPEAELLEMILPVIERAKDLDALEAPVAEEEIRKKLSKWKEWASQPGKVRYGNGMYFDRGAGNLMRHPTSPGGIADGREAVPNSMRTVEPETGFYLCGIKRRNEQSNPDPGDGPQPGNDGDGPQPVNAGDGGVQKSPPGGAVRKQSKSGNDQ